NAIGTNVQTLANTVYNATNSAQTTFYLATNASEGDLVQVNGTGTGGWVVSGHLPGFIGATWTPHDSSRNWWSVASSSDGANLVAVVYGGQIYTSSDSGMTWTPHDSSRDWSSVASSSAGTRLVAVENGGQIYTS